MSVGSTDDQTNLTAVLISVAESKKITTSRMWRRSDIKLLSVCTRTTEIYWQTAYQECPLQNKRKEARGQEVAPACALRGADIQQPRNSLVAAGKQETANRNNSHTRQKFNFHLTG